VRLVPRHDQVIIEMEETINKVGAIYVPDTAKDKPVVGRIIDLGNELEDENWRDSKSDLAVGDRVVYREYTQSEVSIDGKKWTLVKEDDILAKVME